MLNTTGSSEVSNPRALEFDDDKVVGSDGSNEKSSKSKNPTSTGATEEPNVLTSGARLITDSDSISAKSD